MSGSSAAGLDSWVGGSDDWANGADWSEGAPPNGASATIDPANPVFVTIRSGETEQVGNLAIAQNTLELGGTLQLSGTLDLTQSGTLSFTTGGVLAGGTLADNTSSMTNGYYGAPGVIPAALSGVTIQGGLNLAFGTLGFENGTTVFADASHSTPGLVSLNGSTVILTGPAQSAIAFNSLLSSGTIEDNDSAVMLVLAAGTTQTLSGSGQITSANNLTNDGAITTTATGSGTVTAQSLTNNATIGAIGGVGVTSYQGGYTLTLAVPGTIANAAGATIAASGAVSSQTNQFGTVVLGTGTGSTLDNAGTITAGADGVVSVDAAVVNTGTITAGVGGTLAFDTAAGFSNTGSIAVNGGTLEFDGAADGTTLGEVAIATTNGTQTNADGSATTVAPTLRFANGTYNNAGATLAPGAFGALDLDNETIIGGTIDASSGTVHITGTTTLDGVTVIGPVVVDRSAALTLLDGTAFYTDATLTQYAGMMLGLSANLFIPGSYQLNSVINTSGSDVIGTAKQPATLTIGPTGGFTGAGTIYPSGEGSYSGFGQYAPVTILNQGLIEAIPVSTGNGSFGGLNVGAVTLDNQASGTIGASGNFNDLNLDLTSFSDEGSIAASNYASVQIAVGSGENTPYTLASTATVQATSNGSVDFSGPFTNDGTLTANGGTIEISEEGGTWLNDGVIAPLRRQRDGGRPG